MHNRMEWFTDNRWYCKACSWFVSKSLCRRCLQSCETVYLTDEQLATLEAATLVAGVSRTADYKPAVDVLLESWGLPKWLSR